MSKLRELIDKYCPNGVEYKPLGNKDVSIMQRGTSLTKKDSTEGVYPVISVASFVLFYILYDRKRNVGLERHKLSVGIGKSQNVIAYKKAAVSRVKIVFLEFSHLIVSISVFSVKLSE